VGKPGDFEYYSFYKVLNGDIPADYFAGKIILIGPYSYGMLDQYVTPTDYKQSMNGVEIHANIIQNFLEGNFKRNASPVVNIALVVIPGMLSFIVFYKSRPLLASMILFLLLTIYIAISIAAFRILGLAVYLFYPLMLMIIIYFSTLAGKYMLELFERNRITGIFGKYVAPEVVKHIIEGGEDSLKLGGTKKEITVMFVDIRGFTPLSEKVEPDVLVSLLNEYFNVTVSSIFNFSGTLDKFIGDATMAVFNAPLPLNDHAFKAINAALEMKTKSAALEKKIYDEYGLVLRFGIGINTGEAVTGNIGTGFRMEYTAIGDTVNTAARLESNAKPGEILISSSTYELVKDRVKAVFYGELNLKGKDRPFPVYKVARITTNKGFNLIG
jgi:adenylate cyclase